MSAPPLRPSSMLDTGKRQPRKPALSDELLERLRVLGELREQGKLTEAEFSTQKQKLLPHAR